MSEFTLKIELGNAAMMDANDVSEALSKLALHLRSAFVADLYHLSAHMGGKIYDANGNCVGQWNIQP